MIAAPHILAFAIPHTEVGIDITPALSLWILLPVFALALGLIVYLTLAQRRVASRLVIATLILLRVFLLAFLFLLFLQPAVRWTHTRHTAGTLWLLLDQSPSMAALDPQATPVEHLRWADALGQLSHVARPRPESNYAALLFLRCDFARLRPANAELSAPPDPARIVTFAAALQEWAQSLDRLTAQIAKAPVRPANALKFLRETQLETHAAADAARRAATLRQAAEPVRWGSIQDNLALAASDVYAAARRADEDFLAAHYADASVTAGTARVTGVSRADLALQLLTTAAQREEPRLQDVLPNFRTRVAAFSDGATLAPSLETTPADEVFRTSLAPAGQSTNLVTGLQLIAEQLGPDEPASVIIVSDGRHNAPGDPVETARLLAARGVRIYGLLVGSAEVSPDAAVDQVDAPDWIYKDDTLRATATIRLDGLAAGTTAKVTLLRDGKEIDSQNIQARSPRDTQRVNFSDKPPGEAAYEYEVRVAEIPGEGNLANNRQTFRIAVKKDKLCALLIDDQPRWEFQYLRNHFSRDPRLKLQSILLSPAQITGVAAPAAVKASPQNPRIDAQILPQTREEWAAFDIIILGDLTPDIITAQDQQFIAAAVRDRGATLVIVAGDTAMPASFVAAPGQPLVELLPVTLTAGWTADQLAAHSRRGFRPALATEGAGSILADFGLTSAPESIGQRWYFHSPFTLAKPSATVILQIAETAASASITRLADARKKALLASMNVGLGKVLYLASDESWRWRNLNWHDGHSQFWGQVVRWAVGSELPAGGRYVRFGANRPRYQQTDPITITARVIREDLTPYQGLSFSAIARPVALKGAATAPAATTINEARFVESPDAPGYYRATLTGLPSGDAEITLRGAEVERLLNEDPSVTLRSVLIHILPQLDLEQRNMNTDRDRLTAITDAAGGATVDACSADTLAAHLPRLERTYKIPQQVGLFTDPKNPYTTATHWLCLALFTLLLAIEWSLRKRAGMV